MGTKIDKILEAAQQHCEDVIKPNVGNWNAAGVWPRTASLMAGAAGLTGLYAPEEWGG
ncbi:MAG: acyl-CoA dehydrogenase family protein, partial [Marinosulfonomonas sp.]|nr:acyl-CoA dehydrogenase family protein [Marinosulfonomonas sp.]